MKLPADWNMNVDAPPPDRQAREAILEALGSAPDEISLDGRLHRFKVEGDTGTEKTGWYVLHGDGVPAGAFGDWRRDISRKWHAVLPPVLSDEDRARIEENCRRAQALRDEEMKKRRKRAAKTCREIWANAPEANVEHSYLQRKKIENHGLRMTGDGRLIMPIYIGTELSSLQYIRSDGRKEFHYGGEIGGGYFRIPASSRPASDAQFVVEGYATGASVHEATGCEVWVALNAGNLSKVGKFLRENLPNARIVFVGDNDESGVGQKKAREAAESVGGKVIVPPDRGDANDYAAAGKDLRALLLETSKQWILPFAELCKKPQPLSWLIKNWIQERAQVMVFGASGVGKTFVVLDMALSIACPQIKDWHGFKVKHGPVVYLAGEGHAGLRARLVGWAAHKGIKDADIYVSEGAVDLNTGQGLTKTIEEIRSHQIVPCMIVVDTLNRFMVGDENKAQDAKTMLDACAALGVEFQCTVILVHHTGVAENAQGRARGSSAWRGAMDIELMVKGDENGLISLMQTKNKDSERQSPLNFELVTVDVPGWLDEDGEQVTTKVMGQPDDGGIEVEKEKALSSNQAFGIKTYIEAASTAGILNEHGEFQGLDLEEWRKVFFFKSTLENDGAKRTAFHRARNDLVKLKWFDVNDNIYTPIGLWAPFEKRFLGETLQALHGVTCNAL